MFKYRLCLPGSFLIPLLLWGYLGWLMYRADRSLVPLQGTLQSFDSKGSHSSYRKIVKLEEYAAALVRYYEGFNTFLAPNLYPALYQEPPAGVPGRLYTAHPVLQSRSNRQVNLYIFRADRIKLQHKGQVPYLYLHLLPHTPKAAGYYLDLYMFVFRYHYGEPVTIISLIAFLLCCAGAAWWYEKYKALRWYMGSMVLLYLLMLLF